MRDSLYGLFLAIGITVAVVIVAKILLLFLKAIEVFSPAL